MSWFRLDDKGAFHAKVVMAGNEAYGAWVRAGQWSSDQGTDGLVPRGIALTIGPPRLWARLVAARPPGHDHGLAEVRGDGWALHDFLDYNPSAEEAKASKSAISAARSEAGRRGGLRRGEAKPEAKGQAKPEAKPKQNEAPIPIPIPIPIPDPSGGADPEPRDPEFVRASRSEPEQEDPFSDPPFKPEAFVLEPLPSAALPAARAPKPAKASPRKTRCPASTDPEIEAWALALEIPVCAEAIKFVDYHAANGSLFADWRAAWRNWKKRAIENYGAALGDVGEGARPRRKPEPIDVSKLPPLEPVVQITEHGAIYGRPRPPDDPGEILKARVAEIQRKKAAGGS